MDQVVDLSMMLYPARVFPARQSMFIIIIIIIERKDLGGVMLKDCKDTLQKLKTVTKRECDANVWTEYLSDAVVGRAVESSKASDKQFRLQLMPKGRQRR